MSESVRVRVRREVAEERLHPTKEDAQAWVDGLAALCADAHRLETRFVRELWASPFGPPSHMWHAYVFAEWEDFETREETPS